MLYLIGLLIAAELAAGQYLWKLGVDKSGATPKLLLSPYLWAGLTFYLLATIFNIYALSKFQYSSIQAVIIPLGLVAAYLVGTRLLGEKISALNIIGLAVIIVGVLLATKK